MMIFGTGTMVASKYMLSVCAADYDYNDTDGADGKKETFSKALYQSFIMFLAMFCCLPLQLVVDAVYYALFPNKKPVEEPAGSPEEKKARRITSIKVFFLVFFDWYSFVCRITAWFASLPSVILSPLL